MGHAIKIGCIVAAVALVVLVVVGCIAIILTYPGSGKQPNIVFILADDLGWNDVGYHGSVIKTPTMDELAATGVKLENYYVQQVCTPSRSQLLTGRYQIHTGLQHSMIWPAQPNGIPLNEPTIADKLKEQGYATHMVGKWHVGFYKKEFTPTYRGFDSFFGSLGGSMDYFTHDKCYNFNTEEGKFKACGFDLHEDEEPSNHSGEYSTHLYTRKAQEIIAAHAKGIITQPLFLYLPYQAPHSPLQVPSEYTDQYDFIKNKRRRTYAGMVTCLDKGIANITQSLKEHGLWDNTILVFSSDNGGKPEVGGSNWPLRGTKGTLWEGGVRSVGFVHSPLLPKKSLINKELIHISDWFPTLLQLAGGSTAELQLDGFDAWETISHGTPSLRKELLHNIDPVKPLHGKRLFNDTFDNRVQAGIRHGQWKLVTGNPVSGKPTTMKNLWLFDILADPREKNELSESHPDVVKMLLDRLEFYNSTAVPCRWPADAAAADPRMNGGVWGPWQD